NERRPVFDRNPVAFRTVDAPAKDSYENQQESARRDCAAEGKFALESFFHAIERKSRLQKMTSRVLVRTDFSTRLRAFSVSTACPPEYSLDQQHRIQSDTN